MKPITVEDLYKMCEVAIKEGYGKAIVQVSDDDECNGFHSLWEGFSQVNKEDLDLTHDYRGKRTLKPKELVFLN